MVYRQCYISRSPCCLSGARLRTQKRTSPILRCLPVFYAGAGQLGQRKPHIVFKVPLEPKTDRADHPAHMGVTSSSR